MPKSKERDLTDQQKLFVAAYLQSWNATQAYMDSHPKNKSRAAAAVGGNNALRNPKIRAAIDAGLKEKAMGSDEVLARLADMANSSHFPFIRINDDGAVFFNFNDPEAKKHLYLIKKLKTKRTRRVVGRGKNAELWEDEWVEVELHDAQRALELIGKHHRLFQEQIDLTTGGEKINQPAEQIEQRILAIIAKLQERKNAADQQVP